MLKGIRSPGLPTESLDTLKGRNDPKAVRAAATEMEAVFVHEMLKAMRKAMPAQTTSGLGSSVYTTLFDIELSRLIAERGIGLKEAIVREIEGKTPRGTEDTSGDATDGIAAKRKGA